MSSECKTLNVEGMSCNHCVNSVKNSVGSISGVNKVEVDLAAKKVTVEFDGELVNIQSIKDTIEDAGYDVV